MIKPPTCLRNRHRYSRCKFSEVARSFRIKQVHNEPLPVPWDEIGKLQFDFLVRSGLQPHHYFLDVGCGSLRGGVHFIPYLETAHYLGIDKEVDLINAGIERELGHDLYESRRP